MRAVLRQSFFNRPTLTVAEELLGTYLVRQRGKNRRAYMITEVEAYDGFQDKASHAHAGRTKRNAPMFGPAGVWYVYLVYGMHWMLNVVTGEQGFPAAILIRGVYDEEHEKEISGPARVTKTLNVSKRFDNIPARRVNRLWIEGRGQAIDPYTVQTFPRIGVDYAGDWAKKPYRFVLQKQQK